MCHRLSTKLEGGWNPWVDAEADRTYKLFSDAIQHYRNYVTKLLNDGKVELKGCKSQKTGNSYDTTVVMSVDENQRAVFQLSFEKGDAKYGKSKNKKD